MFIKKIFLLDKWNDERLIFFTFLMIFFFFPKQLAVHFLKHTRTNSDNTGHRKERQEKKQQPVLSWRWNWTTGFEAES